MDMDQPDVVGFFDHKTFSVQYVCIDPATDRCAIIDPVLDYDENAGRTRTDSADEIIEFIGRRGLTVDWILDTHPHADHLSAAIYLQQRFDAPRAIGRQVVEVQKLWKDIYNFGDDFYADGRQWDRLFDDGDRFKIGSLEARVMLSPGHTLASITYVVGDAAFVHDTLFMPDFGTARADFPGGDAATLYRSIEQILALPDDTRLFTGHDYMPDGREPCWQSTVAEQRAKNPHLQNMDERAYVELRNRRDAELPLPALMLAALQINIRGGRLPEPEDNGTAYLKIPLNAF
jgi:glyoxylase-like metal-dependent hydrolase (beta-lactamase superfamily II)